MTARPHPLGAHVPIADGLDRAFARGEQIGRGAIGRAGFAALMTDVRFAAIPKILETLKGEDDAWDRINLALLRQLVQGL